MKYLLKNIFWRTVSKWYMISRRSFILSRRNSPLRAWAFHQTAGITFTCPQREIKVHTASLREMCCQQIESAKVVGFLGQNYRYKSIATQIPPDAGLVLIRTAVDRTRDRCFWAKAVDTDCLSTFKKILMTLQKNKTHFTKFSPH